MKYKYIIVIFAIGFLFNAIGAFLKITHMTFGIITGNFLLLFGMIGKAFAAIILIIKLLTQKKESIFNK